MTKETVTEQITEGLSAGLKPDTENSVIRGVKLIGFESRNNRTYLPNALRSAVPHYEGVKVNLDHPAKPQDPRSVKDRIGVIRSARFVEGQGVFGDFHYNPKHPAAEQVVWDAENNPSALGFSHNANLQVSRKNGKQVVEAIAGVRSADLVADPATTGGFFESEQTEGVIDDKIEGDEQKRQLRKITDAARSLISETMWSDENTVEQARTAALKVAEDLVAELKSFKPKGSTESGEEDMKLEELTLEDLKKSRPDLVSALEQEENASDEKAELEQLRADKKRREFEDAVEQELKELKVPADLITDPFRKALFALESKEERAEFIADRLAIAKLPKGTGVKPVTATEDQAAGSELTTESFTQRLRRR